MNSWGQAVFTINDQSVDAVLNIKVLISFWLLSSTAMLIGQYVRSQKSKNKIFKNWSEENWEKPKKYRRTALTESQRMLWQHYRTLDSNLAKFIIVLNTGGVLTGINLLASTAAGQQGRLEYAFAGTAIFLFGLIIQVLWYLSAIVEVEKFAIGDFDKMYRHNWLKSGVLIFTLNCFVSGCAIFFVGLWLALHGHL